MAGLKKKNRAHMIVVRIRPLTFNLLAYGE